VFAVAPGLAKDKEDVYKNAIKMAMNDPEYQIKELNNRNPLVQREGKELTDAIASSEKFVKSVKYWEGAK
jgi:tripartite-type tricarboxylate transporter receptor subunit TctC